MALALLEALPAGHGVDEEVGDVDLLAEPLEAGGVGDVALANVAAGALQVCRAGTVAHEAAHTHAGGEQRVGEATADEPGRSGYERAGCDQPRLAAARRPAAVASRGGGQRAAGGWQRALVRNAAAAVAPLGEVGPGGGGHDSGGAAAERTPHECGCEHAQCGGDGVGAGHVALGSAAEAGLIDRLGGLLGGGDGPARPAASRSARHWGKPSVEMKPGSTRPTWTPCGRSSAHSASDQPASANLEAL